MYGPGKPFKASKQRAVSSTKTGPLIMSLAVKHFCLAISSEDEPWYSGTSRFINGSCSIQIPILTIQ